MDPSKQHSGCQNKYAGWVMVDDTRVHTVQFHLHIKLLKIQTNPKWQEADKAVGLE